MGKSLKNGIWGNYEKIQLYQVFWAIMTGRFRQKKISAKEAPNLAYMLTNVLGTILDIGPLQTRPLVAMAGMNIIKSRLRGLCPPPQISYLPLWK